MKNSDAVVIYGLAAGDDAVRYVGASGNLRYPFSVSLPDAAAVAERDVLLWSPECVAPRTAR